MIEDISFKRNYKMLSVLGKGSMGITYQAENLENKETIAIKAISLRRLVEAKQLELLEREVEILKKLNHPGIPQYLDYFEVDSDTDLVFYLVQQLAPGKNLDEWVKEGWRGTEEEIKAIAEQMLNILIYLHELEPPVIHRDIKPQNIIRSPEGKIFLVDFGAVQNAYYSTFMGGSTTVGTFGYMSLEQAGGKAIPASDLYSLGATLVYLLTHRSPSELSQDGLTLEFRSSVQISDSFADWIEKLLEPEIEERFQSAQEALTALNHPELIQERKLNQKRGLPWVGLVALIGIVSLFNLNRWTILSNWGYPPPSEICQEPETTLKYLSRVKISEKMASKCLLLLFQKDKMLFADQQTKKAIVELLILNGANLNVNVKPSNFRTTGRDEEIITGRKTPLMYTAIIGNSEIARILIKYGADVNQIDVHGNTALSHAIGNINLEIVKILIKNGADVNPIDRTGRDALVST